MQILIMIKNQLKLLFNNRMSIFIMIAAPILLTWLFSISTSSSKTNVYLADNDKSKASKQLIAMIEKHEDLSVTILAEKDIKNKIDNDDINNGAVIDAGFERSLKNGKALNDVKLIENYDNPDGQNLSITILSEENALQKITADSKNVSNVLKVNNDEISKKLINKVNSDNSISSSYKEINTSQKTEDKTTERLIGFLVMFIWFVVVQGFRTLIEERENNTFNRIKGMPTSYLKYLISKIIATYILGLTVVAAILLVGKYALKASIVNNIFPEASIFAIYLFAVVGIVMIFVPFVKKHQTFTILGSVLMVITGMLGGSFFSMDELTAPKTLQIISRCMPENWGIKALKDVIFNNSPLSLEINSIVILLSIGVLGLLISTISINIKMKAEKSF
ncbi:ABC transporter permease [Clostridium estertheticum]|uniref:ABC transporter permease n=1 Tax=Clostridium estertheticum TaxID=238834 RepID=UPI001CF20D4B|nr:ABC transporter permease [Clostridium estertheticum]MCB2305678.1 ABC transporter permease [Clostridium estertheticum]MCB2344507.1 ABC transporter permease [Clostridium estertheticum]MCB2348033.1 ABC transporter permease [Clostridium estertheticum]WAG45676.1 ABC transporter permease [Clostridium estertheticum]